MTARDSVRVLHVDDFERTGAWLLARRSLELESFGMNLVDIAPGDSIPEHDETDRDHEEVFVALSGAPTLVVDGVEHPLPEGSFARLDPQPRRTVVNNGDVPARVLIVSAPRGSGYVAMEWA